MNFRRSTLATFPRTPSPFGGALGKVRSKEAISRILYPEGRHPFIWTNRRRRPQAANPGTSPAKDGGRGQATLDSPIRPCSAWGLPCLCRHRQSGALLPHPFTLTSGLIGGGLLSAALSLALPRPGVTRHAACLESGLSSPRSRGRRMPASFDRRGSITKKLSAVSCRLSAGKYPQLCFFGRR